MACPPLVRFRCGPAVAAGFVAGMAAGLWARPGHAYEFRVSGTTTTQAYQVRWFRFTEPDRMLNRRRFTQDLRLDLWDLLSPAADPGSDVTGAPVDLYFSSALRLDHDFGSFTRGDITFPVSATEVATDPASTVVPELQSGELALDVLTSYVGGRRLLGRVDFQLGRQLVVDALDWYSFDGLAVQVHTPWRLVVSGHGGLRVRGTPPYLLGSPTHAPDGTSSAGCAAFDEELRLWLPAEECEKDEVLMPTFGVGVQTEGIRGVQAGLSYRRSVSPSAENLYPGDAPGWGVNEESLTGTVRGDLMGGALVPWADVRWSFLLATVDEAHAGLRLRHGEHTIIPELGWSYPSFDGDSIFNVFSMDPYAEGRLGYDLWPGAGPLRAHASAFVRRFSNDAPGLAADETVNTSVIAAGGSVGGLWRRDGARLRLDLFYDDGYGGLRAGGDASGRWQVGRAVEIEGRVTLILFEADEPEDDEGTNFGVQGGLRWAMAQGVALHLLGEDNVNQFDGNQLRVIALLDLAFVPEL